jgi:hypothetical protein
VAKKRARLDIDTVLDQVTIDAQVEREEHAPEDRNITAGINTLQAALVRIRDVYRDEMLHELQSALRFLQGRNVAATEDKRPIVMMLRVLLQFTKTRIACPECGAPSLPYFLEQAKGGIIQCQHRTTEGVGKGGHVLFRQGDPWPAVRLIAAEGDDDSEEKSEKMEN